MRKKKFRYGIGFLALFFLLAAVTTARLAYKEYSRAIAQENVTTEVISIRDQLSKSFQDPYSPWPESIQFKDKAVPLTYTFDGELNDFIEKTLLRFRPDYSAIVVLDNETGAILSAVGYEREGNRFPRNIPFSSTHPSASLFKIVTTAGLLQHEDISKETRFNYKGRGTTLYRYQLNDKINRWTRSQSLGQAFASSNNVVFARAAIKNLSGEELLRSAEALGFNQDLMVDIDLANSIFLAPSDEYNLAELASGFNKQTYISIVHAALLSSVVANAGIIKRPYIVQRIQDETNKLIYRGQSESNVSLDQAVVADLRELMISTVETGTARRSFRRLSRKLKSEIDIGGKTGSITGGNSFWEKGLVH